MASVVPLTFRQSNDEVVDLVITPLVPGDDLSTITKLVFVMKPDVCTSDTNTSTLTLTSTNPTQISITAQSSAQIDATVYVPSSALVDPYSRVWRVDAYVGTTHRTAIYGPVAVIDL